MELLCLEDSPLKRRKEERGQGWVKGGSEREKLHTSQEFNTSDGRKQRLRNESVTNGTELG